MGRRKYDGCQTLATRQYCYHSTLTGALNCARQRADMGHMRWRVKVVRKVSRLFPDSKFRVEYAAKGKRTLR